MKYVGVDWAYRTAQWCALDVGGEIAGEGRISADRDGLARLVLELGDGLQTQWGVRVSLARLRRADGLTVLERAGVPEVWRRSVSECLALIDFLDARIAPLDAELRPFAHADPRAVLLDTIPASVSCSP